MYVNIGPHSKNREISIKIDPEDTWDMDHTLSLIIVPMLKQLKETKQGVPHVEDEDVPQFVLEKVEEKMSEEQYEAYIIEKWNYILDEMIWAFEQIIDNSEDEFFLNGRFDKEGYNKHRDRIQNGTKLFGLYFEALWD